MSIRFFNIINLALGTLLVLGVMGLVKNIVNIRSVKGRLSEAEKRVLGLEDKQRELEISVEEKKTENYIEKEIRNKLGLVKRGEGLVVLPRQLSDKSKEDTYKYGVEKEEEESKKEAIITKWIRTFGWSV